MERAWGDEKRAAGGAEQARCLDCGRIYTKPLHGRTLCSNPGCPSCGYLGWVASADLTGAGELHRLGAGHPLHLLARPG